MDSTSQHAATQPLAADAVSQPGDMAQVGSVPAQTRRVCERPLTGHADQFLLFLDKSVLKIVRRVEGATSFSLVQHVSAAAQVFAGGCLERQGAATPPTAPLGHEDGPSASQPLWVAEPLHHTEPLCTEMETDRDAHMEASDGMGV
jgi:hypothetical protein